MARAAEIGTISIQRWAGRRRRLIKVLRSDGRPCWKLYARHLWEARNGAVPPGKRVIHEDGDTLNDDPANLILGDRGDTLFLALENEQVERRRLERSAAPRLQRNQELPRLRRAFSILRTCWYLVEHEARLILLEPCDTKLQATSLVRPEALHRRSLEVLRGPRLPNSSYGSVHRGEEERIVYARVRRAEFVKAVPNILSDPSPI